MNTYECLQDEACGDGIDVIDYTFHSDRIKGLYCDGTVAIRKDMNTVQKACTLAEELGHHHTSGTSSPVARLQPPDRTYGNHPCIQCWMSK